MWDDIYPWITFLTGPLVLILVVAYVFRPSARRKYRKAKQIPFEDGSRQAGDRN